MSSFMLNLWNNLGEKVPKMVCQEMLMLCEKVEKNLKKLVLPLILSGTISMQKMSCVIKEPIL